MGRRSNLANFGAKIAPPFAKGGRKPTPAAPPKQAPKKR